MSWVLLIEKCCLGSQNRKGFIYTKNGTLGMERKGEASSSFSLLLSADSRKPVTDKK